MKYFTALLTVVMLLAMVACTTEELPQPEQFQPEVTLVNRSASDDYCPPQDCESMVKIMKALLLERAGEDCGVFGAATSCCQDGQTIYFLYQVIANCDNPPQYDGPELDSDAMYPPPGEGALAFDVSITECINGGRTLEIVADDSGRPLPKGTFEAHWWVNGAYFDSALRIECVYGKKATLLIIDHADKDREHWMKIPLYPMHEDANVK
jgi:hypothetical protein